MRSTRLDDFPDNLLREILPGKTIAKPHDFKESLAYVLATLSDNERNVIYDRFRDGYTLREEGDRLGVTQERIRQIEAKAKRKIAAKKEYLTLGVEGIAQRERETAFAQGSRLMQEQMEKALEDHNREITRQEEDRPPLVKPVEEMGLSVRSYNALKRAGLNTAYDILELTNSELHELRNIGSRSAREIIEKLKGLGYNCDRLEQRRKYGAV